MSGRVSGSWRFDEKRKESELLNKKKLVDRKRAQHKDVVEIDEADRDEGKVVDIMEALKKSLARKRKAA